MGSHSTTRRRFFLGVTTALAGAVAGCSQAEEEFGNGQAEGDGSGGDIDADATVIVAPGGEHEFDPHSLEIDPGDTVEFVWEERGHTVTPDRQPDESSWEGEPSARDEEYVHAHTFETEGLYWYYCAIHGVSGSPPEPGERMNGEIVVGDVDPDEIIEEEDGDADEDDDVRQLYSSVAITGANSDDNTIELYHAGGDPLPANDITITVRVEGNEVLNSLLYEATDDLDEDSVFEDGDTLTISLEDGISVGDEIVATIFHEPTESVVSEPSYRRW